MWGPPLCTQLPPKPTGLPTTTTTTRVGGSQEGRPRSTGAALIAQDDPHTPAVSATVGGRRVRIVLDTAATQNLCHRKWVTQETWPTPTTTFHMATRGNTFTSTQKGRLTFEVNDCKFTCEAAIVDQLQVDIIIGYPWMAQQGAVIDTTRGCVHLGKEERQTLFFENPRNKDAPTTSPPITDIPIGDQLPEADRNEIERVLQQHCAVFSQGARVTPTTTTRHEIRLKDGIPVRTGQYRYTPEKKRLIGEQVEQMLAAGVIEPSHSEYNSPVVIVTKKNGEPRFCVDYRKLNAKTVEEYSPLPPIQESLKDLGQAKVFTTLDLRNGYWQIAMAEASKRYTAFSTPDGAKYQFRVMPFGLQGAPATFQRLMAQEVLVGYLRDFAIAYLDDIIIYSKDLQDHQRHLQLVLERVAQHGLKLNLEKCRFASTRLEYLGHVVTAEENQPQTAHLDAIQNAPVPTTRKALRSFIGLINWIRDYIPECSRILAPLTDLTSSQRPFKWTEAATQAFRTIKQAASQPLHLKRPDFSRPFFLQTDASTLGASAVLYQGDETSRAVISYASLRFREAEQRYHINEQECLAIVWAVKRYRPYLEDKPFVLRTDSRALTWLSQFKDAKSKLMRWSLLLQEFQFTVEHVPGKDNELPDALSRNPGPERTHPDLDDTDRLVPYEYQPTSAAPAEHSCLLMEGEEEEEPLFHYLQDAQQDDPELTERARQIDPAVPVEERPIVLQGGLLRQRVAGRLVALVPPAARRRVIHQYHDHYTAGHPGIDETIRVIREKYLWPHMVHEITDHVRCCRICSAFKRGPHQTPAPLRPHGPTRPFEVVSVDIIGPLTTSRAGKKYGIVVTDTFSRWTEMGPVKSADTRATVKVVEQVFQRFGYPMAIITDNGPQFTSGAWDAALRRWQTLHWTTPIYHARANPVERRNQEIKKGIRIQLEGQNPERWDEKADMVLFNMRCRQNAATGYSPGKALFGSELRRPGEWRDSTDQRPEPTDQRVRNVHANELRYRERRYAQPNAPMPIQPQIGDLALVRAHPAPGQQFGPKWLGPYPVVGLAGPTSVWVERPGAKRFKYHLDQIRLARRPREPETRPAPADPREPPPDPPTPGPSQTAGTANSGQGQTAGTTPTPPPP